MTARSLRRSLARWSLRSPTVRRGLVLMHVVLVPVAWRSGGSPPFAREGGLPQAANEQGAEQVPLKINRQN